MQRVDLRNRGCAWALGVTILVAGGCDDAAAPAAPADALGDAGADLVGISAPDAASLGPGDAAGAADAAAAGQHDAAPDLPGAAGAPEGPGKLDLIFMIDNSGTMAEEQEAMSKAFPAFINALAARTGGLPDLHLAIISSNVGAGPSSPATECPPGGDRGRFQVVRPSCGLDPAVGSFLSIDGTGAANFTGGAANLPSVFQCLASLGTRGCGYEHQLLSLYLSLDGRSNPENAGFLRDDAVLGVVMLSDEDDCSGSPSADFFASSIPGQSGSVRCSLLGHVCGGKPIPAMAFSWPLADCKPYERAPAEENSRLIDVRTFVDFLRNDVKRGRADRIFVATIIGWNDDAAAQYTLRQGNVGMGSNLESGSICDSPTTGAATPGIRLHAFAKAFENNAVYSICRDDLITPMTEIGSRLSTLLDRP